MLPHPENPPSQLGSFNCRRRPALIVVVHAININAYIQTGLAPNTHYYYRVRAVAPPTAVPPLATTMSPASTNVSVTASTLSDVPVAVPPRVFYRLRVQQN